MAAFGAIEIFQIIQSRSHIHHTRIQQSQGSHGFHNDYGSGNDDRVVAPFDFYLDVFPLFIYSFLGGKDGRSRLYMGTEHQP